jgi:fructose-bisphosphate aldolase class 1
VETIDALRSTTAAMLARGKGILAADEPAAVADERFAASGIVSGPDARRDYRELLFATPGLGSVISAAILVDERCGKRRRLASPCRACSATRDRTGTPSTAAQSRSRAARARSSRKA